MQEETQLKNSRKQAGQSGFLLPRMRPCAMIKKGGVQNV